jgi:hypothetical protein
MIYSSQTLKDGSLIMDFAKQPINTFFSEEEWLEVYSVNNQDGLHPIPGTYYYTGSGHFIIVNKDCIYEMFRNWGVSDIKRYHNVVMMIRHVKQSDIAHIDDYTTYIRIIEN